MSDDVTRLAEVLAEHEDYGLYAEYGGDTHHICMCDTTTKRPGTHRTHVAEVIAPLIAEARLLGATQAKSDAIDAHAELVARMEELVPAECWVSRTVEFRCTDYVGGKFANGHVFSEDMCCLPCRIRAALNDPTEETP